MINSEDKVPVNGEDGSIWEVKMAGDGSPMVLIVKGGNMATARMISRAELALVAKAVNIEEVSGPRLIPTQGITG
jgi:hypothetical protein